MIRPDEVDETDDVPEQIEVHESQDEFDLDDATLREIQRPSPEKGYRQASSTELELSSSTLVLSDTTKESAHEENQTLTDWSSSEKQTSELQQVEPLREQHDELRYEVGSPHADFELYWNLEKAHRRADISGKAATADDFWEAVDAALSAINETGSGESKYEQEMRTLLEARHGREPYTTVVRTETTGSPSFEEASGKPAIIEDEDRSAKDG